MTNKELLRWLSRKNHSLPNPTSPGPTLWKDRQADSCKLSSVFQMYIMAYVCLSAHVHTHVCTIKNKNQKSVTMMSIK